MEPDIADKSNLDDNVVFVALILHTEQLAAAPSSTDSAMPDQAVSPQAVDTAPTDQIKKTQLRRPDTGSLSTQLSRRTHTVAHTQMHTPSASLLSFSPPLSDTLHTSAGRTVANYHLTVPLPGRTIQLSCPPPSSSLHSPSVILTD